MVTGADNAIHFPEEKLSSDQLAHSSLFLLFSQDATAYAIARPDGELVSVGRTPGQPQKSQEVFKKVVENSLFKHSEKASLALAGGHFVLAPSKLVDEKNAKSVFELHTGKSAENVATYPVGQRPMVVIEESIPGLTEQFLSSFPFGKVFSARALLIDALIRQWEPSNQTAVFANVSDAYSDIYFMAKGQLQLANRFETKTHTDILYFILNVFEQSGLDTKKRLFLSGQVEKGGELYTLCEEHLDSVQLHEGFDKNELDNSLSSVQRQQFAELFNLCSCAS